jgi:hypothetical protein
VRGIIPAQKRGVGPGRPTTVSEAIAPRGAHPAPALQICGTQPYGKSQPSTEITSPSASPDILSGVRLVYVVAGVACTSILMGDGVGGVPLVLEGGTK